MNTIPSFISFLFIDQNQIQNQKVKHVIVYFSPFYAASFLSSPENVRKPEVLWGYRNGALVCNRLKTLIISDS